MYTQASESVVAFTHGADKLARGMGIRLTRARNQADIKASMQGHTLGSWMQVANFLADEAAICERCHRGVAIVLAGDPVLSGSALTEGCHV